MLFFPGISDFVVIVFVLRVGESVVLFHVSRLSRVNLVCYSKYVPVIHEPVGAGILCVYMYKLLLGSDVKVIRPR